MTSLADIMQWIEHPETLNSSTLHELRTLVLRYPYFQSARLLYLYNLYLMHDVAFGAELRRSALFIADAKVLFYLIEGDNYRLKPESRGEADKAETAPASAATDSGDRTLTLIDSFLSKQPDEQFLTSELDYTTDYASYLMNEPSDEVGDDDGDGAAVMTPLDSLEASKSDDETEAVDASDSDEDEGCFTETLAKIYIKQRRYDKALEIIRKLSLKYPKKNIYFADQIRFLERLIENERTKQL